MKVIKHLTLFLLLTVTVNAQNIMTSSPYSMFGIGEIVTGLYGSNSAMGGGIDRYAQHLVAQYGKSGWPDGARHAPVVC